jgi:hypothetical protein
VLPERQWPDTGCQAEEVGRCAGNDRTGMKTARSRR